GLRFDPDGRTFAIVWTRKDGYKQLVNPDGFVRAEANAVNNDNVVVGMVDGPNGSDIGPRAFLYEKGRLRLFDEAGPDFTTATAITDRGDVAGILKEPEEKEKAPARPDPAGKPK